MANTWNCSLCALRNNINITQCQACFTARKKDAPPSDRLVSLFGQHYQNSLLNQPNRWISDLNIAYSHMEFPVKIDQNRILNRGFAINNNGWIALMTMSQIQILSPNNTNSFDSELVYQFPDNIRLVPLANQANYSRIRFVKNDIYVFNHLSSEIYHYKIEINNNNNNKFYLNFIRAIKDKYFDEADIVDVDFTHHTLLILFSRWIGVYKLYNNRIEWYHAISFVQKHVHSSSFYIINNNDDINESLKLNKKDEITAATNHHTIYINVSRGNSGKLYKIHPSNPQFSGTKTIRKKIEVTNDLFCSSKRYGTFWVENNGKQLHQAHKEEEKLHLHPILWCQRDNIYNDRFILSHCTGALTPRLNLKDIQRICNICYDESFGMSGRLILIVLINNKYQMTQMFNNNELKLLYDEYQLFGNQGFNLLMNVYSFIYGDDIINKLFKLNHSLYDSDKVINSNSNHNNPSNKPNKDDEFDVMLRKMEQNAAKAIKYQDLNLMNDTLKMAIKQIKELKAENKRLTTAKHTNSILL